MRNAKPFARPTKNKVPKVMSFVIFGQKLLGNLPPRAIQTMSGKDLKIITAGSKGYDQIKREYGKYIIKKFSFKDKKQISFNEANIVGQEIISLFEKGEFDKCILFYNKLFHQ